MLTDVSKLEAGRETDAAVARALGWTEIKDGWSMHHGVRYIGISPGGMCQSFVPRYSTTDAALTALEEWQRLTGGEIEIVLQETDGEHKWAVAKAETDWFHGQTLYLAICRLIVESGKCDHLP